MTFEITVFNEPLLEFRHGQKLEDPHDGLTLFGPYDADTSAHPKNISFGVIATKEGQNYMEEWIKSIITPLISDLSTKLWPPFPGFETVFDSYISEKPAWKYIVDKDSLLAAATSKDRHKRTFDVVNLYMDGIESGQKKEDLDLIFCVIPDEIYRNCRPKSIVKDGWGTKPTKKQISSRAAGQSGITEWFSGKLERKEWNPEQYHLSPDFRRQIKAKSMKYQVPIQIIRESTISSLKAEETHRQLTTPSDVAWNLSTAMYYKAGGKPWKLADAREGVCYIGLAFKKVENDPESSSACCAAQMFLDSGDGIVFLGDEGPWYSSRNKQFRLTQDAAKNMLKGVLSTYNQLGGKSLKEIFLHSRSYISELEYEGYKKACPDDVNLVAVSVRTEPHMIRLFRNGRKPIMRGTMLKWNENKCYLFASGFKPKLGTYDGLEIPRPLKIEILHGKADIKQVAFDILSLTKLNYNACKFGDAGPVTINFSDAVGEILVNNPSVKDRNPKFKFYI